MPFLDMNVPEAMATQMLELAQLRAVYVAKARKCKGGQRGYYTRRIKGIDRALASAAEFLIDTDGLHTPPAYTCVED